MDEAEKEQIRLRVAQWRVAAEFMERERAEQLRSLSDDECREIIARLFLGSRPEPVQRESGLVELQRALHNLS